MNTSNKVAWFVFVFSAICVGLYHILYWPANVKMGLLQGKSNEFLGNTLWNISFYGNIIFGGIALLIGWSQFSKTLRTEKSEWYRNLRKVYIVAALIGGVTAFYIGFFAFGGVISSTGLIVLAIVWLYTTVKAYIADLKKDVALYRGMMVYSYAACFAAVTFRIWLPLLTATVGNVSIAYQFVTWLCWVPNMIFAYFWVRRKGLQID